VPFVEAPGGALVHFVNLDLHSEALHAEINEPVVLVHGLGCNSPAVPGTPTTWFCLWQSRRPRDHARFAAPAGRDV
jgi:hypothetical protein